MIKFFRNLPGRQAGILKKLLEQCKTANPSFAKACATAKALGDTRSVGTYLKYAIGKILLLIISILIALHTYHCNEKSNLKIFK